MPEVVVVDRPGWVDANTAGMAALLDPLVDALAEKQGSRPGPLAMAIGSRATGVQAGGLLAFLSRGARAVRGLRRRPPAARRPEHRGHRAEAGRRSTDFRLWVCLHEVTHQLQFTAVPWLKDHLEAEIASSSRPPTSTPTSSAAAAGRAAQPRRRRPRWGRRVRGAHGAHPGPAQRAVLDRVTAVMSLVEGHAEYVMDGVGPDVVPTVRTLRKRFAQRRKGRGPLDRVMRRLLGLEQKMKQYAEGRSSSAGSSTSSAWRASTAWEGPANLPRIEELTAPALWVERVLGRPAIPA